MLSAAAALGIVLACLLLAETFPGWMRGLAWVHGGLGALGVVLVSTVLAGPARGVRAGAGHFGTYAGALLAGTLLAGLAVFIAERRGRRMPAWVIAFHATFGIAGYVLFVAYLSMPA